MADTDVSRSLFVKLAGWFILALGAAALLLPLLAQAESRILLGILLALAGVEEAAAATQRRSGRWPAVGAGLATIAAAVLVLGQTGAFIPTLYLITGWLGCRVILLVIAAATSEGGSLRRWTVIAALIDALLALLLLAGLSIATLVVALFGPTPDLIASFAWILAASFAATGLMLLEVAACEREGAR